MKETKSVIRKKSPSLVTTDYDNFKTLRFFINQQHKAEHMMREIENFHASFVQSKLVNFCDYVKEHPFYGLKLFGKIRFVYREYPSIQPARPSSKEIPGKRMMLLCVDPGNFRVLYRNKQPLFYHLKSNSRQYLRCDELTRQDEQLLHHFFEAAFGDPQWNPDTNSFMMNRKSEHTIEYYGGSSSKQQWIEKVACSEDDTFLITENVMDYINLDIFERRKDASMKPAYNRRGRLDYYYYVNSHYPTDALFKRDKIEALLRKRFEKEIAALERAYSLAWKDIAEDRYVEMLDGIEGHSVDENTCVIFNNDIRFVSSNPTKYDIVLSDDESTIDFIFSDYAVSRIKGTAKERTCILTYQTDNNELIDYKIKTRFIRK